MDEKRWIDEQNEHILAGIKEICAEGGYSADVVNVFYGLLRYIQEKTLRGACHATCAALYVALSEMGLYPMLCVGEVEGNDLLFDHSWIMLDGKIVDLAICNTLNEGVELNPVILGKDVLTKDPPRLKYGVIRSGLDAEAMIATSVPFSDYMDAFPYEKNGLWDVVAFLLDGQFSEDTCEYLREKYADTEWEYVTNGGM